MIIITYRILYSSMSKLKPFILSPYKPAILIVLCALLMSIFPFIAKAQLKADFSASSTSDCDQLLTTFSDLSTGNPVSYLWDFGNGYTSTEKNPSAAYVKPGAYTVTLTIKDASGGTAVATKPGYINVRSKPVANFDPAPLTGCAPFQATFTDSSNPVNGTLTTYTWDYGDGSTGSGSTSKHTYQHPGVYPVTLVVTNSFNCTDYKVVAKKVNVVAAPVANFTVAKKILCKAPADVQLTNTSTGDGTLSYKWEFDDGTTSTLKDPGFHTFTTPGIHSIKLTVTNAQQCTSVKTVSDINVAAYTTDFTYPAPVCANTPGVFSGVFSTTDQLHVNWEINGQPVAANPDNTATYSPPGPGPLTVKLRAAYDNCIDSVEKVIDVKASPQINDTVVIPLICNAPATVQFSDNPTTATKWQWDFGDQETSTEHNPAHTYNTAGVFNASLVATNNEGCAVSSKITVNIAPTKITATGANISGCEGITATFSAKSSSKDAIKTYEWDFGDGTPASTAATPSHQYSKAGTYLVHLKYTTVNGCTGTVKTVRDVEIYKKPVPDFYSPEAPTICGNTAVTFFDKSDIGDSWKWDFGDKTIASGKNPSHSYGAPGAYTVQMIVGNHTCYDTIAKAGYITATIPFPRFTVKPVNCDARTTVTFDEHSLGATSWEWNWGDGKDTAYTTQSTLVTHTYPASGDYTVVLTTSNGNCSTRQVLKIKVIAASPIVISTDKTALCGNEKLGAAITKYDADIYDPAGYKWMANGVAYNKGNNESTFTYPGLAPGKKTIQLSVLNIQGCVDTSNRVAVDVHGPVAKFIPPAVQCHGKEVTFKDATDVTFSKGISQWEWDFGDGTPVRVFTSAPFTHTYAVSGNYVPKMTVTDKDGCTSTYTGKSLQVNGPHAVFDASKYLVKPGSNVYFYNKSTETGGTITSVKWDFGDGTSVMGGDTVMHNYTKQDTYKVKLYLTDNNGCADTLEKEVKVSTVGAAFTYTSTFVNGSSCAPVLIRFTNTSLNYTSSSWDFGDGASSTDANPLHTYAQPGRYPVVLTATGPDNSVDQALDTIEVKGPYAEIRASSDGGCLQKEIEFKVMAKNARDFTWDFTDGVIQETTDSSIKHIFKIPGIYKPRLILKDSSGCRGTALLRDPIVIDKLEVKLAPVPATVCGEETFTFAPEFNSYSIDELGKPATYKWEYSNSLQATGVTTATPQFHTATPGKYDFNLTTTTAYGCEQTVPASVNVYPKPLAAITGPDLSCVNDAVAFKGSVTKETDVTWKWDFGNGNTTAAPQPDSQSYTVPGAVRVLLAVTSKNGCTDTAVHPITIRPLPAAKASALSEFICLDNTTVFQASGGASYEWTPVTGLNNPLSANPQASPEVTTDYQVKVTDSYGCINTAGLTLRVVQPVTVQSTSDTAICLGDVLPLHASGADNYTWEGPGLTNTAASSTTAILNSAGAYQFKVTGYDKDGCFSNSSTLRAQVNPLPAVHAGADLQIMAGVPLNLIPTVSSDAVRYNWTPAEYINCPTCKNVQALPNITTIYTLEVENSFGCNAKDDIVVHVLCNQSAVFMPNAFTPNQDGQNERIYPKGKGVKEISYLRIYDRWGTLVFENNHFPVNAPVSGWDGRSNNKDAPIGTYIYSMETVCESGEKFEFKGNILLVR